MASTFDWRLASKCRTLTVEQHDKLFFPNNGRAINKARNFCGNCDVRNNCLEFALENDCDGIWAGTNKQERKAILKFRKKVATMHPDSTVETKQPAVVTSHQTKRKRRVKRSNFRPTPVN